jgi:mannose-6-phosphate isomerase-like protein (cupin superfamily)
MKHIYQLNDILSALNHNGYFRDIINTEDIQAGILRLQDNDVDTQEPHPVDEVYFVIRGDGMIKINGKNYPINEGASIYVPAGTEHQFQKRSEDLVVFYALTGGNKQT